MVPNSPRPTWRLSRFPRQRGDGPETYDCHMPGIRVPPPARGWSRHRTRPPRHQPGSPASAGMVPRGRVPGKTITRFPRQRGDGPSGRCRGGLDQRVPPPARGWSHGAARQDGRGYGSPASAGMVPVSPMSDVTVTRFPRQRGDGPSMTLGSSLVKGVPPPARGWSWSGPLRQCRSGGSPASAGMVPGARACR